MDCFFKLKCCNTIPMKTITVKINVPDDMPDETAYKYVIGAFEKENEKHPEFRMSVDMNHVSVCLDNKGSKETQEQKVKRILESGQTITSDEAVNDFNIPRLSAVIYALKQKYDMNIFGERKMVAGKSIVVYSLLEKEENKEPESIIGKVFDTGTKKYGKVVAVRAVGCDGCVFKGLMCKKPQDIPICYVTKEWWNYQKKSE